MSDTEMTFTDAQEQDLRILVEMIIPASEAHGLPGAAEDRIFADILATAEKQYGAVDAALSALDSLSQESGDENFAALNATSRDSVVETFRRAHHREADLLATLTVQCYYRDDRIMRALDMETRPPFPLGFNIDEGDWSLLAPVPERQEFYRKTS
ncbi:MAG: hypothetical protein HN478_17950 [Rhodospirillaceae bacterium]|jgi:hypothetical protein|nr:hypothetical protein [Rhodospirillaceae bacterium]MBT4486901.1 hypothetical protein [Rhodospirillaceae bacterium]MBT5193764.1 hypothetical protein [Rhodospirillaceae bacterium]MBT5894458.1 hypothetical protein [Rhodospirillaceae bacterium]MBT6426758.1 hypothetical protein [Rhodospirillaceae bacterium]